MLLGKMRQPHPFDGSSRLLVATAFQTGLIRCRQPSRREFDLPVGKLTPVFDDRHAAGARLGAFSDVALQMLAHAPDAPKAASEVAPQMPIHEAFS